MGCIALVLGLPGPASGHYRLKNSHACGSITFTPRSDDAAYDIRARRLICRDARKVVRRANSDATPFGFSCVSRGHDQGLAHSDVRCRRGRSVLVYARS